MINHHQNQIRSIVIATMVIAVWAASGCGKRESALPVSTRIDAKIQPAPAPPVFRVIKTQDGPTSVVLTLRWPAGAPAPESLPALVFCLPENGTIKGRFLDARLGGHPIPRGPASQPNPAGSFLNQGLQIDSAGFLRRWPLYRLNLPSTIFELLRGNEPAHIAQDLDLTLELTWSGPTALTFKLPQNQAERYWRRMAEAIVLNPSGLDRYASAAPPSPANLAYSPTDPRHLAKESNTWARLRVNHGGLYQIGRDDLIRAGIASADANPDALRIFSRGQLVPVIRATAGDGTGLEPGLYFWADGDTSPYSRDRVYWLTFAPGAPDPRIKPLVRSANNAIDRPIVRRQYRRDRNEQLVTLHGDFQAIQAIRRIEKSLGRNEDVRFGIELADCVPTAGPMRAHFEFLVDNKIIPLQPRIEVQAGGRLLGSITIANADEPRGTLDLPATVFQSGRTTMTLKMSFQQTSEIPEEVQDSGLWLDQINIDYAGPARLASGRLTLGDDTATSSPAWTAVDSSTTLALSIDEHGGAIGLIPLEARAGRPGVVRLPGDSRVELFAKSAIERAPDAELAELDNLADPQQGADLLILTHKEFAAEARRLAQHHEAAGWRVRVADIQSVYDSFSDGEFTPFAIRRLLAYALRSWQGGAPAAVLLVGDCNSDYLDEVRQGVRNWIPTYTFTFGTDKWASDYWFTTVAGEDDLGEFVIGRLPVVNAADLKKIVDKLIAYETSPTPGPWRGRIGYVSDDGEFPEVIDGLRKTNTPPAMSASRVFLNELPLEDNWYLPRSTVERKHMKVSREATDAILDTFRRGVVFLNYYGHGSPNIWADERIWFGGDSKNSDNLQLANLDHAAFVACMTCNSGAIDYPQRPWNVCISEDMLRVPNGGAIGCFVPSGPGITYIHRQMSESLGRVLYGDKLRGMGEVTTLAKLRYALAAQPRELVFMYSLLGDPLINLQMITEWSRIDLNPSAIQPGTRAKITLSDIPISSGKWSAQLVRGDETAIWRAEGEISGGAIATAIDCPTTITACDAILRVVAWDDKQTWSGAGTISIKHPRLEMTDLRVDKNEAIVTIKNPDTLAARGELSVIACDTQSTRSLGTKKISLDPNAKQEIKFTLPSLELPARVEARLNLPEQPDDLGQAKETRLEKCIAASVARQAWIPSSLVVERDNAGLNIKVTAIAQVSAKNTYASLVTREGRQITTSSLTALTPQDASIKQAVFNLNRPMFDQLANGSLHLIERGSPKNSTLSLATARMLEPHLRIVPGSVSWRPKRPTQGQTIFVSCEIENIGSAPSNSCAIELRKGAALVGESLPDAMGTSRHDIPRLAPGRRIPVELRWDPYNNAGRNDIQVRIDTSASGGGSLPDQFAALSIEALTKAAFKVNRVWAEAGRNDLLANRINLKAEIANNGQTEARRVMVSFYRSESQTPENEIGQVELERVTGNSKIEALFVWNFKPGVDYTQGQPLPKPTVRVWLRGSSQRFSSTSGEVVD